MARPRVNTALAMGVPGGEWLDDMACGGVRFAVEFLFRRYVDGPGAGIWFFVREPVRIPEPGPGVVGAAQWADEWLTMGDAVDAYRGERPTNAVRRLLRKDRRFGPGGFRIAPVLDEILDSAARLDGPTVAVVVLTASPDDGAAFLATMRKAARRPVFWVFIGAEASHERVLPLGVVDTLGSRPDDPGNYLVLKTATWTSEFGRWWVARRIRREVTRWQRGVRGTTDG
ncbi:hypothetical protein [Streptomyces sp. NPDC052225]|uniref:hypothetical protein n=1 Tax=Streptomyces sp. NPDC052225 TaxID=3154949 RepID=UPI00341FD979